ncbi:MAG: formate/nitrite transporter family protein [Rhodospirillales bacterium]|jgi:formate/nitrite transporter FocA (FNT family)|nr:formate/nitrite transporter family protein [Rhodospirillales bacterium]
MPQDKESMTDRRVDPTLYDAYTPAQITKRFETVGVAKATMPIIPLLALSLLAGAFISFGATFYTLVMTDSGLGLGTGRLLGGVSFCLGLILVVVGGAELFTGNILRGCPR